MRIGKLRDLVTVERKTTARDTDGGERVVWADVGDQWASIEPLSGREFFAAQQAQSELVVKIRMRYPSDVRAEDRITYAGVNYNVGAVMNIENRNREIVCMCSQGVNDGR